MHFVHEPRVNNLEELAKLRTYATDKGFQEKWRAVKRQKKVQLAAFIKEVSRGLGMLESKVLLMVASRGTGAAGCLHCGGGQMEGGGGAAWCWCWRRGEGGRFLCTAL